MEAEKETAAQGAGGNESARDIIPQKRRTVASFDNIPEELRALKQWVVWSYETRPGEEKPTKVPKQTNGRNASTDRPKTWATFKAAAAAYSAGRFDGIGFCCSEENGYVGVDLDKIDGWKDEADAIIRSLDSYTEVSPSGNGYRVFVKGKKPGTRERKGPFEMYDHTSTRFLTITGNHLPGTPTTIEERQEVVEKLYTDYLEAKKPAKTKKGAAKKSPEMTDDEVKSKAIQAGNGEKFTKLYRGEWEGLGYPSQSEADLAFTGMLAFYTQDPEQIRRIFRESGLYRDKWERDEYREEVIGKVLDTLTEVYTGGGAKEKKSQAEVLMELTKDLDCFCTTEGVVYANIPLEGKSVSVRVRSEQFKRWLRNQYYDTHKKIPGNQAVQDVVYQLEARASMAGPQEDVYIRVAGDFRTIYIDLANESGEVVEITAAGWRVVQEAKARFHKTQGMLPLPTPQRGGTINELRPFVNVTEEEWPLLVAYIIGCYHPKGPYPLLILQGGQGSAKSTQTKVIQSLVDPTTAVLMSLPRSEKQLAITAKNGWLISFDNLSELSPSISDALCRLSTGGALTDRTLYTNDEQQIFAFKRPVILNGITDLAERADLGDRAVTIHAPELKRRDDEATFWPRFEEAQPRILGAIFDAVSAALRNLPSVRLASTPRMADFAKWAVAAEETCGLKKDAFLKAYDVNRKDNALVALEHDSVGRGIVQIMKSRPAWDGNSEALIKLLKDINPEERWPPANKIKAHIDRCRPALLHVGIEIEQEKRTRKYYITKAAKKPTVPQLGEVPGWTLENDHYNRVLGTNVVLSIEKESDGTFLSCAATWREGCAIGEGRPRFMEFLAEGATWAEALRAAEEYAARFV
ncbi:hypothetical protein FE784_19875 [Paenibacillus hemerocallicola]|uniref:NrS-1 polymerase-like HBD domain-containing protein n=1 Tax=Paenibacillus hemerocallicola TaxID=1172614 RepID=A0A5C4T890_9BACL|nr:hypothetical protein [Paenibacillus hemerocallicola]TNJ64539.1 hypothetical protein FE784_19875 [Paenibacillus hemerocallicola]